jgi:hypothetical protein
VVIHDFDIGRARLSPTEAHQELIVHANTVLIPPLTLEGFDSVPRWHTQILQTGDCAASE